MPAAVDIVLSEKERKEFYRLCRSGTTPARMKERLSIVLLADEGLTKAEIAKQMPILAHKAACWRNRFAEQGLSGIKKDLPQGGNPGGAISVEQAALRQRIIQATINEKPEGPPTGVLARWPRDWAPTTRWSGECGINVFSSRI